MFMTALKVLALSVIVTVSYTLTSYALDRGISVKEIYFEEGTRNLEVRLDPENRGVVYGNYFYHFSYSQFFRVDTSGVDILSLPDDALASNVSKMVTLAAHKGKIYSFGSQSTKKVREYTIATDTWRVLADAPINLVGCSAVTVGDVIYVFGGNSTLSLASSTIYKYYPESDTWIKSNTTYSHKAADAVYVDGAIYLVGYSHSGLGSKSLRRFDISTEAISILASSPQLLTSYSTVPLENGFLTESYYYDIASNKWFYVSPGPSHGEVMSYCHCMIRFVLNGKAYELFNIPGGYYAALSNITLVTDTYTAGEWRKGTDLITQSWSGSSIVSVPHGDKIYTIATPNSLQIYDTESEMWSIGASLPSSLAGDKAVVIGDVIYFIGNNKLTTFEYHIYSNSWRSGPDLLEMKSSYMVEAVGDKIYIIGGMYAANVYSSSVMIWDTASRQMNYGPPLLKERGQAGSVASGNKIYVAGGGNTEISALKDIEILDTSTGVWTLGSSADIRGTVAGMRSPILTYYNDKIIVGAFHYLNNLSTTTGVYFTQLFEYDINGDSWRRLPGNIKGRHNSAMALVGNYLFFVAGDTKKTISGTTHTDNNQYTEVYDLKNEKILIAADRLYSTSNFARSMVNLNGSFYLIDKSSKTLEIFDTGVRESYEVTFDPMGGTDLDFETIEVTLDSEYGLLPTVYKKGFNFDGWWTGPDYGFEIYEETVVTDPQIDTLYARWVPRSNIKVSYDKNGGDTISFLNKLVTFEMPYGLFPSVAKYGYDLVGWLFVR